MRWSEYEHNKENMNTATTNVYGNSKKSDLFTVAVVATEVQPAHKRQNSK